MIRMVRMVRYAFSPSIVIVTKKVENEMSKNLPAPSRFCIFTLSEGNLNLRERAAANFSVCTSKISYAHAQKWSVLTRAIRQNSSLTYWNKNNSQLYLNGHWHLHRCDKLHERFILYAVISRSRCSGPQKDVS